MEIVIGITKILEAGVNKFLEIIESVPSGDLIAFTTILLSFLIPLFIAQLNSDSEFKDFDIRVILDYVLNFRKLLAFTLVSLIAVIAIGTLPSNKFNLIKIICFILWFVCILFITKKVLVFFTWTKGSELIKDEKWNKNSKNQMRLNYLKKITKKDDLELSFNSIWKVETKTTGLEKEIINIFIEKVNYLINKKDFETVLNLLKDFYENISNRNGESLVCNYLENVLNWWLNLSIKIKNYETQKNTQALLDQLVKILKNSIIDTERIAIKEKLTSFLFEKIQKLVNDSLKDSESEKIFYPLYSEICETLIKEAQNKEAFNGFPKEWKVTTENVKSNNVFALILFRSFLWWFSFTSDLQPAKTINPEVKNFFMGFIPDIEDIDIKAEILTKNIFPEIDTKILSNFLVLLLSSGEENSSVWAINTKKGFGKRNQINETFAFEISNEREVSAVVEDKSRQEKAYSLIIALVEKGWFGLFGFDKESIIKLLKQLKADFENLKFEEKTAEEAKRLEYLEMINELLKRLKGEN